MPPALFFFLKILWTLQVFCDAKTFLAVFFFFFPLKRAFEILVGIALNLLITLDSMDTVKVKVIQLCPVLCDPMDYTVHGILQARILKWVASPLSRESSQARE